MATALIREMDDCHDTIGHGLDDDGHGSNLDEAREDGMTELELQHHDCRLFWMMPMRYECKLHNSYCVDLSSPSISLS